MGKNKNRKQSEKKKQSFFKKMTSIIRRKATF